LVSKLRDGLEVDQELKVRYGLLAFLSQRGLRYVGTIESGWILGLADRAVTESDRDSLRAWLQGRPEVSFAEVGPRVPARVADRVLSHAH
jgi:hypothetical protein